MTLEFKVSSQIYQLAKIQQAIADFSDVSDITYNSELLSISWGSEEEIQEVFGEFMNYVLSL